MIRGKAKVHSKLGIHARPAALIAACAKKCDSDVTFSIDGIDIDPSNYIKLMSLHINCGAYIEMIVDGIDENEVFQEMKSIIETAE